MEYTKTFACDFETSVYEGQTDTEVWAAAAVDITSPNTTESVRFFDSIDNFMSAMFCEDGIIRCYFHNLKFDGGFILNWLIHDDRFEEYRDGDVLKKLRQQGRIPAWYYSYSISDKGAWYSITIGAPRVKIIIQDSLKLIPMSLRQMGKNFHTPHQKLEMDYEGERHAGYELTPDEREYLANDVLVLKEALNIVFGMDIDGLTIGSVCLREFKNLLPMGKYDYRVFFPDVTRVIFEETGESVDDFCRRAYRGGWGYCPEAREVSGGGYTFDVNSLYPSMMHSMSGNYYPIGYPTAFWGGPEHVPEGRFYYIRFKCEFEIKPRHLPTVQIKSSMLYDPREWLKSSDVDGHHHVVELTMSQPEYELFREHYNVRDLEYKGGLHFAQTTGLFDKYIDKWAKIKMESGDNKALRTIAKLFLNNLYGKLAASMNSSYKMAYLNEDGAMRFNDVSCFDKEPGYVPIGAAITAYARCFTIRAAQANYDNFLYADTDSIHCLGDYRECRGVTEDPVRFCCWKCETEWDHAVFARQKTYIEHITREDHEPVSPYYNIKCAGMGARSKSILNGWLQCGRRPLPVRAFDDHTEIEYRDFSLADFMPGLEVPGNLKAKRIRGGVLLESKIYKMR